MVGSTLQFTLLGIPLQLVVLFLDSFWFILI
jgi:hypothetical protein